MSGVGGVLAAAEQPPGEVEDGGRIRLVEVRQPAASCLAEVEIRD
jgi:hypothetical protein